MKQKIIVAKTFDQYLKEQFKKHAGLKEAVEKEVARLEIGFKIAQLRKMRHLSQAQLAKKIKTSQQTISHLEDLKDARINLNTLARVAADLNARLSIDLIPA